MSQKEQPRNLPRKGSERGMKLYEYRTLMQQQRCKLSQKQTKQEIALRVRDSSKLIISH